MSLYRWCGALALTMLLAAGNLFAQEPVTFRYKPEKGQKLIYRSTNDLTQTQNVMDMKIETRMTNESVSSRTVENVDDMGVAALKIKTELFKVKTKIGPLGEYNFDSKSSEREKGSVLGEALTPIYERISGAEFEMFVSARGEVKDVKGYAELLADLIKDNPLAGQFTGGGSNAAAKISMQSLFTVLNEKPVKVGDKWENPFDFDLPSVGKARGKETVTYVGEDKVGDVKTAKFAVTTDMSFDVDVDVNGTKVTGQITTSNSSGTAQFDPAAGRLVSLKNSFTVGGQLNVAVNGMNIPIQQDQTHTVSVELLDKLPE